ncbi:MAG TPA: alpha-amylase family glycosyl hydrolase [Candidatus Wallbacteria bacterium]|mgnify:CR=1 FL=1|nr:alpha-amylase family glycosyl hydrolase [Candidatus Wallbacteria bacterium]
MKSVNEKVFYHIYPLGFCGAPEKNDSASEPVDRLNKITGWISHMKSLGINALYLGPVFESVKHGYDTVNYYEVDRRLGKNETLKKLVKALHESGIDVVIDGVFNHVGRDFFAFRDLMYFGYNSRYRDWFDGIDFSRRSPYNDQFTYNTWAGYYDLVKLNLKNHEVKEHLLNAAKFWIEEFDIDGIRLDAADSLDFEFMKTLSEVTKNLKPGFWLMGEVVHGNYSRWINEAKIDSTTNYECYKGLYSSHNDKNYFEIAHSLKRQFSNAGIYKNMPLYNFADNHDVERVASSIKNKKHLYPLYTLLFMMPGVPSIYYGSEWGIEGRKVNGNDKALRPELDVNEMNGTRPGDLIKHISMLSRLRRSSGAINGGGYEELFVRAEQFGFVRERDGEKVVVMLNSSDKEVILENTNIPEGKYTDLLNAGSEIEIRGVSSINIYPNWGRILRKTS